MRNARCWIWSLVCCGVFAVSAQAENWPGWRGPRGDGSSEEAVVPVAWGESQLIAWKTKQPFGGHSSPIVWGNRVFLVGAETGEKPARVLMCLDFQSGKLLWEKIVVESPLEKKHRLNSWASGTPVTDGEKVYVTFLDQKDMLVAGYDFTGTELWQVRPGVFKSVHGYCSCPIIYQDLLIVNGGHDGESYLAALRRTTGWLAKESFSRTPSARRRCVPPVARRS